MKKTCLFLLFIFICSLNHSISQAAFPVVMQKRMGTMSGQIFIEGNPSPFSLVSFFHKDKGFPPVKDGLQRVPDFISRTDANGKFKVNIIAGGYYLGVLLRETGGKPGPPRPGEKFYFVKGEASELRVLSIKERETVDKGRLDADDPGKFLSLDEFFTVEGIVRDEKGNPVDNVVVLGKSQLNIPRPEFISERTLENGLYRLRLPVTKPFYLIARKTIAGARPLPGTDIGTYGIESSTGLATPSIFGSGSPPPGVIKEESSNKAMVVSGGPNETIHNVDIYMYLVPDPEEIRASIQGTINSPKFEKGSTVNNIPFSSNSRVLEHKSYKELDLWVDFLNGVNKVKISIMGHTDNVGSPAYNDKLSKDRAQAVADYMIAKGINPNRLIVVGFGSTHPVATNDSDKGRNWNRRVEIKFVE